MTSGKKPEDINNEDFDDFKEYVPNLDDDSPQKLAEFWGDELKEALDDLGISQSQLTENLKKHVGKVEKKGALHEATYDRSQISNWLGGKLPKKIRTLAPLIDYVKTEKIIAPLYMREWISLLRRSFDEDDYKELLKIAGISQGGFRTRLPNSSGYIGIDREIDDICSVLVDRTITHAMVITGLGGSGKTMLASKIAFEVVNNFSHGVYWLSGQKLTLQQALRTLITATPEIEIGNETDYARVWENLLRNKIVIRALLVLDDVSTDLVSYFSTFASEMLCVLLTAQTYKEVQPYLSSIGIDYVQEQNALPVRKPALLEKIEHLDPRNGKDFILKIYELSDGYPEPVSKAYRQYGAGGIPTGLHRDFPEAAIGLHITARKMLAGLGDYHKKIISKLSASMQAGQWLYVEEIAEIWEMENVAAKYLVDKLEPYIIRDAKPDKENKKYRVHRVLIEACNIARKFNRDPQEFLLSNDELF